jgi:hypothetical protein
LNWFTFLDNPRLLLKKLNSNIFMVQIIKKTGKALTLTVDILKGVNATVWGGIEESKKVDETGITGMDIRIGAKHAAEDFACNDYVCFVLDLVGCTASRAGFILGNIYATKKFTKITSSVTLVCRGVCLYYKNYGTVWGCTVAARQAIKTGTTYFCTVLPGQTLEDGI